jgi:membrane-bound lytic murein transglycosylase A
MLHEEAKEHATFAPVSFSDLDGWQKDAPSEALAAFKLSCASLSAKPGWKSVCDAAQTTPSTGEDARKFFEADFRPYALAGHEGEYGLFTGYYMPELRGSMQREGEFQTPLYARPDDLVSADLGLFKADLKGQKIVGKVRDGKFVPYDERAAIAKGALGSRAKPLVWVDDPVDAFFLEVQGSGRVRLGDGKFLYLGYDNANGRAYTSIGRVLKDRGEIQSPVTMAAIRTKLSEYPSDGQDIMNENASYVFFRPLPGQDAIGAEGVALTPKRSLAVDPNFVPLGAPVWIDTTDGNGAILQRLMIAQDTGGAIKGPVRGDVFWGAGGDAATQAGSMQSRGRAYILLPKSLSPGGI